MQPYYTIMRLPGETEPEFIQMLPFTPRSRDNLAAWLVARSDGEHYGTLRVFQFPKQKVIFGPRQVVARINQDQTISPQITLWNQQGSQVIWGTLMVIPIEESLIYVRPLYLRASGRPDSRAHAGDRRLPESDRDGADARTRRWHGCSAAPSCAERDAERRHAARAARVRIGSVRCAPGARRLLRISPGSPPKRADTTTAPSRRSAPATGRSTARSSSCSATCSAQMRGRSN